MVLAPEPVYRTSLYCSSPPVAGILGSTLCCIFPSSQLLLDPLFAEFTKVPALSFGELSSMLEGKAVLSPPAAPSSNFQYPINPASFPASSEFIPACNSA